MFIDVDKLLDQTVTVIFKIAAQDAGTQEDQYKAVTVSPAFWATTATKSTDADGTVHVTESVRVQLPDSSAEYIPYGEYIQNSEEQTSDSSYTISLHDYLCKGRVGESGIMTREKVLELVKSVPHCVVSSFRDLRNNGGVETSEDGCLKYANIVYVEGM